MNTLPLALPVTVLVSLTSLSALAQKSLPAGYWPESRVDPLLQKTETVRLAPELGGLDANERAAVQELLAAGAVMQQLYEAQRHHQALTAHRDLLALHARLGKPSSTQKLLDLYRLSQGPIATTLENGREPFLPVAPQVPGRNVYPLDATKAELEAFLAANPSRRAEILGERTVVRRATKANLTRDLAVFRKHPVLRTLHADVAAQLQALAAAVAKKPDAKAFYAVPYPVAYADELLKAFGHLNAAAAKVEANDEEFARYLRNRARDLLSNDYESGDASWITGRFGKLNAQIGAYETYDDALFGVKAFHGLSVLLQNAQATAELQARLSGLQALEDALPYERRKRVREDVPVGVYDVIADFGQARGTNTASILPNDALFSRRYGRIVLLRQNIMKHPELSAAAQRVWKAVVAEAHADLAGAEGPFQRTLWHEIGHYLGVDRDRQGRTLDVALADHADALEELKADLVSLYAAHRMKHPALKEIQASGIQRTLQNVKPRSDQPYQKMQLAQFNYFLEQGLIAADPQTARLTLHAEKYPEVVASLLKQVLDLQDKGDPAAAAAFFERWGAWKPEVHEKLAERIRQAQGPRWRIVRYEALGE